MTTRNTEQPISDTASTSAERRALLATCVAAAARAAEIIRAGDARRATLTWEHKAASDFVSEIDRDAEHAIAEVIRGRHTDATLLAEEMTPDAAKLGPEGAHAGLMFVADPLDGTTNFLHGVPWYAVSIAALVDGEPVAGVVLNAATGELFSATAGGGARRAGQPMAVSAITDPARALIGTGMPFKGAATEADHYLKLLPYIMRSTAGIRRFGAAALDLADVAAGRYEAFFEMALAPWDIAAGILLVREAGGVVTTMAGERAIVDHTSLVAGSPTMHRWLLEHLTRPT
jgi:myo-inositol-1(or 4)-monophosphatase